jgi:hypothetical protein
MTSEGKLELLTLMQQSFIIENPQTVPRPSLDVINDASYKTGTFDLPAIEPQHQTIHRQSQFPIFRHHT